MTRVTSYTCRWLRWTWWAASSAWMRNMRRCTALAAAKWLKAKRKALKKVYDVAAELLELHARRAAVDGHAFNVDNNAYQAFAQDFPFEETPGQMDAIQGVLEDMRAAAPMDRLVCGDSGFGKTEVAMRAAFVAVENNKQVALLAPHHLAGAAALPELQGPVCGLARAYRSVIQVCFQEGTVCD